MAFNVGQCAGRAGPGAPFPQWTVISSSLEGGTTGVVGKVTNPLERTAVEVTAFPSKVYFFTSQQAAQNCINASGGAVSKPLQSVASAGQGVTNAATGTITAAGDVVGAITKWLGQPQIWLRGAEIVAGLMLLYLGLKASVTPGGVAPATRGAKQTAVTSIKKVAKVVAK